MDFKEYMDNASSDEKLQFLLGMKQSFHEDQLSNLSIAIEESMSFYYHGYRTLEDYKDSIKPIMDKLFVRKEVSGQLQEEILQEYQRLKKYLIN